MRLGYDALDEVRCLFGEYAAMLNMDLGFQGYEDEVRNLPGHYALPRGRLYLLEHEGRAAGCGALRPLGGLPEAACEMKRLYVRPSCRGLGYGKRLARELIADAAALGYRSMYLDTFTWMEAAVGMYRGLGFREVDAYYVNPFPGVLYFRLDLASRPPCLPPG